MAVVSKEHFMRIQHIWKFSQRRGSQWVQVSIEMRVIATTCHNF